jgi:hypothetical protein
MAARLIPTRSNDMSNGEKMHNALHKALIKDLEKNWALDWDDTVQSVYDGFIEDLQEDIRIEAKSIGWDDGDGDVPIGCEVFIVPYISDAGDMPEIGKPIALSEILIALCLSHGEEEADIMLEKSLSAFRAKRKR